MLKHVTCLKSVAAGRLGTKHANTSDLQCNWIVSTNRNNRTLAQLVISTLLGRRVTKTDSGRRGLTGVIGPSLISSLCYNITSKLRKMLNPVPLAVFDNHVVVFVVVLSMPWRPQAVAVGKDVKKIFPKVRYHTSWLKKSHIWHFIQSLILWCYWAQDI